jgi:hypothetical protein
MGMKPPMIRANLELAHRYRFTSTAATLTSITDNLLLTAAGVMATTATAGTSLYQSVRLRRITIWSPPASQGAAVTCSIFWLPRSANAGIGGRATEVSDTTVSVAAPATVSSVPPKDSQASFWQNGSSTTLVQLVAPAGSIIDVELSLTVQDGPVSGGGYTPAAAVLVAATAGVVYYCSLDSATKAGSIYQPVSLTSI